MAAYNSITQYTRRLDDFRGVDLTSGQVQVSPRRFAYAQNMWRDHSAELGGAIETIPGYRAIASFGGDVHGMWMYRPFEGEMYVMVHAGTVLYQFRHADRDLISSDPSLVLKYDGLADNKSTAFAFNGRFYILDGESYRVLKPVGDAFELSTTADTAYLPVTYLNGEMYEQRNMLTDRTINRETQAGEYDASMLLEYERTRDQGSLTFGRITGFRNKHKADSIIILQKLRGVTGALDKPIDYIEAINESAFEDNLDIRRVMISSVGDAVDESMFGIDERAFYGAGVETVDLCDVWVDAKAFGNCRALKSVYLNNCNLSQQAFFGCTGLETIKLVGARALGERIFEGCSPREIWLGETTAFVPPGDMVNEGYEAGYYCLLPYVETSNPDYDEASPVTLDNFPYLLDPNPSFDGSASNEYKIYENNQLVGDAHMVGYIVLLDRTRPYTDEFGDTEDVDIDWESEAERNKLPFKIEPIGNGEYRARAVYRNAGTFGSIEKLERVYTAYALADISDDLKAALDELYRAGVEVIYETPTPVALDIIKGEGLREHTPNMMAREVVVYDPADSVESVKIDEEAIENYGVSYTFADDEWHVDRVIITEYTNDDDELTDHDIDVVLNCKPGKFTTAEGYLDFRSGNEDYKGTSVEAITQCRISETFDDRVFLTGNPALPNTVFYCQRDNTGYANPAYWGVLNYVNDGVGQSPNVAMLATAGMLMVLKGNDPHDATVYYHAGVDSGNDVVPRLYPSERGLSGIGCNGIAVNFRDDAVFMSSYGLEAVGKQQVNLERTLMHRSSLVDRMLTRERLADAVGVEWGGYLMIFTPSGNVYMADSRQMHQEGERIEYEWYLLTDVGVYEGQTEDYEQVTGDVDLYDETGLRWLTEELADAYAVIDGHRYQISLPPAEPTFVTSGAVWESYVYKHATGSEVWHDETYAELRASVALIDGEAFFVNASGRYSGGEFKHVTAAADVDGVLYFGCANGMVCCFNTDKRDAAVRGEQPADGTIHRDYYTFNGRQIDSFVTTAYDHAGFPDLAKKTVKKSLVLHAKTFPGSRIEVKVRTNRNDEWRQVGVISTATYDFYSLDYASSPLQLTDETLSTIREKEKKWALKQLYFGSLGFKSPWGIYSAGYRFTVTGRIKS